MPNCKKTLTCDGDFRKMLLNTYIIMNLMMLQNSSLIPKLYLIIEYTQGGNQRRSFRGKVNSAYVLICFALSLAFLNISFSASILKLL